MQRTIDEMRRKGPEGSFGTEGSRRDGQMGGRAHRRTSGQGLRADKRTSGQGNEFKGMDKRTSVLGQIVGGQAD